MYSKNNRPVNLNLFTIKFPAPAIASILHRISGVIVFLFIPLLLWLLQMSLTSTGFDFLYGLLNNIWMQLLMWAIMGALVFHLIAGLRHLLMDAHVGDSLRGGRIGAWCVFILSFLVMVLIGIWLWW